MGYLLSEIREPNCVNHSCFSSKLILGKPILVIVKIGKIEFYKIGSNKERKRLKLVNSLRTPEKVVSISILKENEQKEAVLFLTESFRLSYLKFAEDGKHLLHYCFMNVDARGQQELCDIDPILLSGHSEGENYILLHCFQGIVQLIRANDEQSNLGKTNRKRSRSNKYGDILWERPQVSSFFLGNIVTQRMVILKNPHGSGDVLAIQYRNFSYNFSMRYYRVDLKNMKLHLENQFDDFEQEPTDLIAPEIGGVLCLSPETILYFPSPHVELTAREGQQNSSVCFMGGLQFLNMHLSPMDNSNIMSRYFVDHVCIDASRTLLVSSDGMTYMLYLESKYTEEDVIVISSFRLIPLSKTTVPVNVHHISGSLFFASSRFSRSILFEVLPRKPYINICLFYPSNPPILSLDSKELDSGMKLMACQGGYDSGEFCKILSKKFETASLIKISTSHRSLVIIERQGNENEHSLLILFNEEEGNSRIRVDWNKAHVSRPVVEDLAITNSGKILACSVFDGFSITITDNGVFIDDRQATYEKILHCKQSFDGTIIYISDRNKLTFRLGKDTWTYPLDRNLHICSCDIMKHESEQYILLAYWEGTYQLLRYNTGSFTLILDENLNNSNATITSCSLAGNKFSNDFIYFFLISSDGLFSQHKFDTSKQVISSVTQKRVGDPLYRILRYGDSLLMAGTSSLIGLYYDPITSFYKMSSIGITYERPDEVIFLKDNMLAISRRNEIEFIKFKEEDITEDETIYSTLLNLKSLHIEGTDLSVLISFLTYFSDISDDYEKKFSLKLIDDKNMNIIDIFEFDQHGAFDLVDLSLVTDSLDCLQVEFAFVVLNSSSKSGQLVLPFYIESNKIKQFESSGILGLSMDGGISLQAIKPLKDFKNRFLLIGNVIFIIDIMLDENESRVRCCLLPSTLIQTPSYAIGATMFKSNLVFGDLVKGIINVSIRGSMEENDAKKDSKECYLNNQPFFLSALEELEEDAENSKCIFGDSLGNISTLEISETGDYAQTMAINIGDQINVVKKIPELKNSKFLASFEKREKGEKTRENEAFGSRVLVGTTSGGLFLISEISDDKGFRSILETCQKEIVNSMLHLFDVSTSKASKYENWLYRLDWKSLRKNLTGECMTRDTYEIIDLRPFKQWLFLDFYLSSYIKDHSEHSKLKDLLVHCYEHKDFLQRIVYYSDLS